MIIWRTSENCLIIIRRLNAVNLHMIMWCNDHLSIINWWSSYGHLIINWGSSNYQLRMILRTSRRDRLSLEHTSYLSRAPRAVPVEKIWSCGEICPHDRWSGGVILHMTDCHVEKFSTWKMWRQSVENVEK